MQKDADSSKNCLKKPTNSDKWRFTLYTVIIFLLVFNSFTYILMNKLLGNIIGKVAADSTGCPTKIGFILHTIVFTLILRYIMDFDI